MREKILAQLITKYAGVSKTALGLIADKLSKKVTEESGIDQAITDFDNAIPITEFAADLQREADRRVGEAKKEWEKKNPPKPSDPPKQDDPPKPTGDEMPAWAKVLHDQINTLTKEKVQGTMKSKATELLKEVPASYWGKRALPEKEDELQVFVDEVKTDYTAFKQEQIDAGLMVATPPAGGGSGDGAKITPAAEKAIDAEIKEWAEKSKPVTDTSTKK